MTLSEYQLQRVIDIRQWYEYVYRPLDGQAPESIRYMALWAVFNALYNIAEYPKIAIKNVFVNDGITTPIIKGQSETNKLKDISKCFAGDDQFTAALIHYNKDFITHLSTRTPEVEQPAGTKIIQFEHKGQEYTINLADLHGIASLDQRVILQDGTVLFQYHQLDLDLDAKNLPRDSLKFYQQLIIMLYQLRNNIVHGGSAAFFDHKTRLTVGAIRLLESLIQYLFDHVERLQRGEG